LPFANTCKILSISPVKPINLSARQFGLILIYITHYCSENRYQSGNGGNLTLITMSDIGMALRKQHVQFHYLKMISLGYITYFQGILIYLKPDLNEELNIVF
jgi:hypothetical protein